MILRVRCTAFALANGFMLHLENHSANVFTFRCHRSHVIKGSARPRCVYQVHAMRTNDGEGWIVDRIVREHNHSFEAKVTMSSLRGGDAAGVVGGRGGVVGAGVVMNGKGKQKRDRGEDEIEIATARTKHRPRTVVTKSSPSGRFIPSPHRRITSINAVASGSGSRGIPATQYHAEPSTSNAEAAAPRSSASTSRNPLPWSVVLTGLIKIVLTRYLTSAPPTLVAKSRYIAGILIIAGLVNRHEFCKLIYTFNATSVEDRRLQWFMRRLRAVRGGAAGLSIQECMLLRQGFKMMYKKYVPERELE